MSIILKHQEGLDFLQEIEDSSIDLVLTDPPYITSHNTGMDKWVKHVAKQDLSGAVGAKCEQDWEAFQSLEWWHNFFRKKDTHVKHWANRRVKMKADFLKYGSIYGKKYAVTTDYGKWDSEFTIEKLEVFIKHFHRILKPGGTCIVFFDLWKITNLREMFESCVERKTRIPKKPKQKESKENFIKRKEDAESSPITKSGFKQIRFIEWIKINPQPINSNVNYLTNCREIALLGIKKSNPTFNSKYDNGIYEFPFQGGKDRFHPTQKSLLLFEALIKKHSDEGDLVLDCFAGSATSAIAAINTNRSFMGCELEESYYSQANERIKQYLIFNRKG